MLSRKLDSTNTITSSTNAALPVVGQEARQHQPGTRLSSKWRDSSAKPSSRPNRLASITHSCARWRRAGDAGAVDEGREQDLVERDDDQPDTATRSVWWWNSATPASVGEQDEVDRDAKQAGKIR